MSALCPACGVAVVSGYVRCPKCGAHQPSARRAITQVSGGTTVEGRGEFPVVLVVAAAAVVLVVLILVVTLGGGDTPPASGSAAAVAAPDEPDDRPRAPTPTQPDPVPQNRDPVGPDPEAVAGELDRTLKRERLWGTVQVIGGRVDVRSGACADPGMAPVIEAAIPPLRDAGVTKLRCLEKSGAVAFERDL